MTSQLIQAPAGYIPQLAVTFADAGRRAVQVSATDRLPVAVALQPSAAVPVAGTLAASGDTAAFAPELGRPVVVSLSGRWSGTVRLLRSTDGGATRLPVTLAGERWGEFRAACNEPVWTESEAGALLYLSATLTDGAVDYRVSQ